MSERMELRRHVEHLVERAQKEILEASRELTTGVNKGAKGAISADVGRLVDDVFDFSERVIKGQRRMVNEVVKAINEQTERAAEVGRITTQRATKKRVAAKKAPAKKKAAAKKAPAKKRAPAKKKAAAKKASAKKAAVAKSAVAGS
jgi:colicin import membrane protein